ncbi:GNAT family N-acetyltransferase [Tenacibaculum finnmarkense genomovar finnmarkense]|uniref:GNAT family N-acetyltransferase n=1 Tax=Tenacibaculum finnmarkense genomovar finnmarkense TaxID=1458503 RepID=A0AAP1RGD5_9FLAO|nr:GNAT family N-acetyltransferase [Tenacibaculum finnmarkense]MBE7653102.1 GNAT family N-acetyltransferase [Tenacibaculum finnmarkense genomovar finnmarkense]MBE7660649.1 GNAT family N-acetyltransferase [Tenacibaculum finnmarkense genomovar finnmarkense]MBE7693377.1 GNAT family N-acetyltransferase [Tenacibaculum finnmarkense genomovar finnmarkense]MBE7695403.1 GNAT family N-acetyltransferase [Tenacibaculum finnmarkense genomovar finnmarkense]MCD8413027.1 GNAT family N-acetyltransferase [Tenac
MNYPTIFPKLSTERLTLRQVSFNDKRAIFKLRSNKEINKLITRETPKNLNDADAFIQACLDNFETQSGIFWAIELQESAKIIGSINLYDINSEDNSAKISYELMPDYQKEGFMDQSMKTILAFTQLTAELKTIDAITHQNNSDAITLLEKNQFILQENKKEDLPEDNAIFRLDINQE